MAKQKSSKSQQAFLEEMGQKIKEARLELGLSQSEVAKQLKKRQASISDIENGKMEVSASELMRIAFILNKPVSYFFPNWIMQHLQPEDLTPGEAELLKHAKKLPSEDLQRFIIQVKAIAEREKRLAEDLLGQELHERDNLIKAKDVN